ncbi:NAD+ diphosphatase [Isoptericola jiangsuensis]|uniref:NAD(+) diphosphatase n=1 Tax=Isoptericola jiangsuensis TaxID=548579 RepID=A0A2A9EV09_9MICO|nr:NAD(+) diphosphatase [Isoptericola jiangsuensis]PFG42386.1 NAD+ diphosphatase [Isoptericola jiangsuensis]
MDVLDLPFTRTRHDRAAHRRTEPDLVARALADPTTRAVVLHRGRLAVAGEPARAALLPASGLPDGLALFLGEHDGAACLAVVLPADDDPAPPAGADAWAGLRDIAREQVAALAADDDAAVLAHGLAVEAVALAGWHGTHGYCPRCGAPSEVVQGGWARRCPVDGRESYPRTDPAVIMAVVDDDDRLLLGHAATWAPGRFSTLAGFVEAGEALEDAVRREVAEEAGVTVGSGPGDVVYRGSQPWPFPASLMLGFRARAVTTEVRTDDDEVTDARWFTRAGLLAAVEAGEVGLPGRASIARALVEEWYGGELPGSW